jgi:NTE family protein
MALAMKRRLLRLPTAVRVAVSTSVAAVAITLLAAAAVALPAPAAAQAPSVSDSVPPRTPEAERPDVPPGPAAPSRADTVRGNRPRIGLVLGGGGARGVAHAGVLKVLEELRVPVDLVVGTSIGALAGGLFAAGVSPAEMERWLAAADWNELFRDQPSYADLSIRRKREAESFPVPLELGVGRRGLQLPSGLIAGQKLNATLRELTFSAATISDFDSLAVPFRAVTTDVERGTLVVLGQGDLVDAMRASMSVPGVFTPYRIDDRLLVDGGLLRNLPVDIALDMGADIVICVDVGSELMRNPGGATQVLSQVSRIMTRTNSKAQRELLHPGDVLIQPELDDIGASDFHRALAALAAGEKAARALAHRLRPLSLDSAAYAERRARRLDFASPPERVDFVSVGPYSGRSPSSILDRIAIRPGRLDTVALNRDIASLYSLGIYERVDYRLETAPEGTSLRLRVREKSWGPAYLRFRLSIRDRLGAQGRYSLAAHLLVPQLNSWGAELVGDIEVGEVRGAHIEFFQPLGVRGLFYLAPSIALRTTPSDQFVGDVTVARFRNSLLAFGIEAGLHPSEDTEIALRLEPGFIRAEPAIGDPSITGFDADLGRIQIRAHYAGLDDPVIPRHGIAGSVRYDGERSWLGADALYDRYSAEIMAAFSRGRNTLLTTFAGATSSRALPPYGKVGLGGFLFLSGYAPGSLSGDHMAFARALFFRAFGDVVHAGLSLEVGNAWEHPDAFDLDHLRFSAALAAGLRTAIGPIYIGWGTRGEGDGVAYLTVGQTL